MVRRWEDAKRNGTLQVGGSPTACCLSVDKARGSVKLQIHIELVAPPPTEAERLQQASLSQERAISREVREAHTAQQVKDAQTLIRKLPFAIHFAFLAGGSLDLETRKRDLLALATATSSRHLLGSLAKADCAAELHRVVFHTPELPRLRVPSKEPGDALLYTAIVGRDGDQGWRLVRLDGPHRQNASKLTREAGCDNLLIVKIEEPAERDLLYRVCTL